MPEREGLLKEKDRWQEGGKTQKKEIPRELPVVDMEGLKELGFSDYEIEGARLVEMRRRQMLANPRSAADFVGLKEWNRLGRENPQIRRFQRLFEEVAAAGDFVGEARARTNAYLQKKLSVKGAEGISGELLFDVGHQVLGDNFPTSETVGRLVESLRKVEIVDGKEVTALEALTSPGIGMTNRLAWLKNRFEPAMRLVEYMEEEQRKKKEIGQSQEQSPEQDEGKSPSEGEKQPKPEDLTAPHKKDKHTPTMDEREKQKEKTGSGALYIVRPGKKGFYETESWQTWDGRDWDKAAPGEVKYEYKPIKNAPKQIVKCRVDAGQGEVPLMRGQVVTKESQDRLKKQGMRLTADFNGHVYVSATGTNVPIDCEIEVTDGEPKRFKNWFEKAIKPPAMAEVPKQALDEISRIKTTIREPMERARAWRKFVRKYLTYSNDSKWNKIYLNASEGYLAAVAKGRMADCDVANTFYLLGCSVLGVYGELAGGYQVKKLENGEARLTADDGHAIAKIYDPKTKELIPMDATPANKEEQEEGEEKEENEEGDQEEEQQDEQDEKEDAGEGEDKEEEGEEEKDALDQMEEEIWDDEEIDKLEEKYKKEQEKKKQDEEKQLAVKRFAEEAGCSEEEAKEALKDVEEAMNTRGEGNELIIDRLVRQFMRIIQERTQPQTLAMPSVPRSEGVDLMSPVEAVISMRAGSTDPMGFGRVMETMQKQEYYGGFRLVLINDGSYSTAGRVQVKDSSKSEGYRMTSIAKELQRVNFLVLKALDRFAQMVKQRQATMLMPLDIETEVDVFRGADYGRANDEIMVAKPLSTELTAKDIYRVWKTMNKPSGGTPDHLALKRLRESLMPEDVEKLRNKKLLMLVVVNADGGSNSATEVKKELKILREMGVIVKGRGITTGGKSIVESYAPEGSWGEVEEYPDFVVQVLIPEIKKLAPRRVGSVR